MGGEWLRHHVPRSTGEHTNTTINQSGAIIDYLIDKYDTENKLHYASFPEKYTTRCWEHFQMSGQGPYFGQKNWFSMWNPEKIPSVIQRYSDEAVRITGVIDAHLKKQKTDYLVGDRVTYADLMFVMYFRIFPTFVAPEIDLGGFEHYTAWFDRMMARPAVAKVDAACDLERAAMLRARGGK